MKKLGIKVLMLSMLGIFGLGAIAPLTVNAQVQQNQGGGFGSITDVEGIAVGGTSGDQGDSLITIIKNFMNWVLGLLGLIALAVLLRGGFQMVTAAGDEEKYKSGFKILKQAAIGLVFIGLSFFVVNMIFWVMAKISGGSNPGGTTATGL